MTAVIISSLTERNFAHKATLYFGHLLSPSAKLAQNYCSFTKASTAHPHQDRLQFQNLFPLHVSVLFSRFRIELELFSVWGVFIVVVIIRENAMADVFRSIADGPAHAVTILTGHLVFSKLIRIHCIAYFVPCLWTVDPSFECKVLHFILFSENSAVSIEYLHIYIEWLLIISFDCVYISQFRTFSAPFHSHFQLFALNFILWDIKNYSQSDYLQIFEEKTSSIRVKFSRFLDNKNIDGKM